MSAPQETTGQAGTNRPADEPMDTASAVAQLRVLVCGLGAGLLVVSFALTAFVYKQNRNILSNTTLRQRQINQLQMSETALGNLVNELVKYSAGKPELMAIFAKHGMEIHPPAATPPTPPPAKH